MSPAVFSCPRGVFFCPRGVFSCSRVFSRVPGHYFLPPLVRISLPGKVAEPGEHRFFNDQKMIRFLDKSDSSLPMKDFFKKINPLAAFSFSKLTFLSWMVLCPKVFGGRFSERIADFSESPTYIQTATMLPFPVRCRFLLQRKAVEMSNKS